MRRCLPIAILILSLLGGTVAPVYSQAGGHAMIAVNHFFLLNYYGFGVLNDTISFSNPSDSSVQIPSVQLGVPDSIASRAVGLRLSPSGRYTTSSTEKNGTTLYTITPVTPALPAHSSSRVSLESYVKDVLNSTTSKNVKTTRALLMTLPTVDQPVSVMKLMVVVPLGMALSPSPSGFAATTNNTATYYQRTLNNGTSLPASAQYYAYNTRDTTHFQPVQFFSATRTLTSTVDGRPQISDQMLIKNVGQAALNSLKLSLLSRDVTSATVVASGSPPLLNPVAISMIQGTVDFTKAPFHGGIQPGNNYTFTLVYGAPSSIVRVTVGGVAVRIPDSPPADAVIQTYTIQSSLPPGIVSANSSVARFHDITPLVQGATTYKYSLSLGWGAGQAVPVASLIFALTFIGLIAYRQVPKESKEEEEEESGSERLLDAMKGFEDKLSLISRSLDQLASKQAGTMGKTDFDKIRGDLDALRIRALQRLNEAKQALGPGRSFDLLTQIQEAARDEDRAAKDLLNLYEQYQTKRMREETFQRLLPNYRRRLNGAINHLSDLLNAAQKEAG